MIKRRILPTVETPDIEEHTILIKRRPHMRSIPIIGKFYLCKSMGGSGLPFVGRS